MKLGLLFLLTLMTFFSGSQDLISQTQNSTIFSFNELEEQVFIQKMAGNYSEALDNMLQGIENLSIALKAANLKVELELKARCECYLEMIRELAIRTNRFNDPIKVLEKNIRPGTPIIYDLSLYVRMQLHMHLGELDKVLALKKEMGYIDNWYLIGPFDNERGGGFDTKFGPEALINFQKTHKGKERDVSWRKSPCESLTGFINLNAIFNPDNQALAYAFTYIISDTERDAALHIGSDEAVKVIFNDKTVLSVDTRRLYHYDQNVVGVHLYKGVNKLLIKVCDQTNSWGFSARLTDPDGASIIGISISTEQRTYEHKEREDSDIKVSKGAVDYFEKQIAGGNTRANLYLGHLHLEREYVGEDEGLATKYLTAFLESNQDHLFGNFLKAESESKRYYILAEKDENSWRRGIEKVISLDPDNVECHTIMGHYYLTSLKAPDSALKHLKAALKVNPDYLPASYLLADLFRIKNMNPRGRKVIEKLSHTAENLSLAKLRVKLGDLAKSERKSEAALDHWIAALQIDFLAHDARRKLINAYIDSGQMEKATKLIKERLALNPFNTGDLKFLAELALGDDDLDKVKDHLTRALTIYPEDDDALKNMGDLMHMTNNDVEALKYYKEALKINPGAKDLRRYMEYLFKSERAFEDDHAVDPLVLLAAHPPEANPDNDSHEYLLLQDVIKVNKDGTSSHYHHMMARVLSNEGAKVFDNFIRFYTPGEQKCRIKTARIIHSDGTMEEAKIDNREYQAEARFGGRAPGYVDLPPLKIGDVVDVEVRIDDLRQSFFGDYFGHSHFFQTGDLKAVKDSRLTLILPTDRYFKFNQLNFDLKPEIELSDDKVYEIRTWNMPNLAKVNPENNMPSRREYTPCVEVSSYEDWNQFGTWWWNLVEEQCDLSTEMRLKVLELTNGLSTEKEKVRAIYNFVVSNIRYNDSWEFGVHGFKPYKASVIFNNRFGDCKDTAILLKALLSEIGVKAYPVIIKLEMPRSKEDMTLALISHFNHCICYIPEIDGKEGLFLDGTAQFHAMDDLPASDLGATVFVVYEDSGRIVTIPYTDPGVHFQKDEYNVTVNKNGSAVIENAQSSGGTFEVIARNRFLNPGKRKEFLQRIFSSIFGDITVEKFNFTDMEDLNTPAKYDVTVNVKDLLLKSGDRYQLRSSFFKSGIVSNATKEERTYDVLLGMPYTLSSIINYKLPDSFVMDQLPADTVLDNEYASYSLTYKGEKDGEFTVEQIVVVKKPRIPATDYPVFRDFCREIDRAEQRMIQISEKH